jgi:integrase/recombinase XerD
MHPREADAERIRTYLLELHDAGASRSAVDQTVSALRFLYVELYGWPDGHFEVPRPRRHHTLRRVPTREQILAMAHVTQNRKHRLAILML